MRPNQLWSPNAKKLCFAMVYALALTYCCSCNGFLYPDSGLQQRGVALLPEDVAAPRQAPFLADCADDVVAAAEEIQHQTQGFGVPIQTMASSAKEELGVKTRVKTHDVLPQSGQEGAVLFLRARSAAALPGNETVVFPEEGHKFFPGVSVPVTGCPKLLLGFDRNASIRLAEDVAFSAQQISWPVSEKLGPKVRTQLHLVQATFYREPPFCHAMIIFGARTREGTCAKGLKAERAYHGGRKGRLGSLLRLASCSRTSSGST